ncbi:hypothetical protein RD792_017761, partial [Penstemon davidsonii]
MMDRYYSMNSGIPLDTTMPISWNGPNCPQDQSFLDHYSHFELALNSMSSSPIASTSGLSNDPFALRELIGKLSTGNGNFPTTAATPPLPSLSASADPGFAERAAKFSCFGSRSFNGRTVINSAELGHRSSSPLMGNAKLPRVSSSPAFKNGGSPVENMNLSQSQMELRPVYKKFSNFLGSNDSSNEDSSVSEQIPSKASNELNSRKRKGISRGRGKSKEDGSKGTGCDENGNSKRLKQTESNKNGNLGSKTEQETKGECKGEEEKQKEAEPIKDYIHVRARRGQATDSHSLAERVRREKISERMKLLQDLVPNCNKVTGKALMLDEIINYVQSLQHQVEFLSMKLSSVNPELDFNMENVQTKDMYPSAQQLHDTKISSGPMTQCSMDPGPSGHNLGIQLNSVHEFSEILPQFQSFCEDDLHSIVQMGFGHNHVMNFP